LVKINGNKKLACGTVVNDGDVIITDDEEIRAFHKLRVEQLLEKHDFKCGTCMRRTSCEFLKLIIANKPQIKKPYVADKALLNDTSTAIVIDNNKCIKCQRCVTTCSVLTTTKSIVLGTEKNGDKVTTLIKPNTSLKNSICLDKTNCLLCGQCVNNCPTGALTEKSHIEIVQKAIKNKHAIVAIAPAVRTALGEEFGLKLGTDVTGKIYAALRKIGFKKVFDISFAADITIMEEATELLHRLHLPIKNNAFGITANNSGDSTMPMFTSCCPAWNRLANNFYPNLKPCLSTTKTPQQIFGAIARNYYLQTITDKKIKKEDLFVVSIMPCIAKKYEASLDKSIDAVLTTRELATLIRMHNIDFKNLEDEAVDTPIGDYSGAGVIFGTAGGVMEAAIRTAKCLVEGTNKAAKITYTPVPDYPGVKTTDVLIGKVKLHAAIVSGAANVFKFLNSDLMKKFQFIEIMACNGGCINGGGQPIINKNLAINDNYKSERSAVLHKQDVKAKIQMSHNNPSAINLYKNMKIIPGDKKAHKLFHH
jgi:iron-only hydrogenase group A